MRPERLVVADPAVAGPDELAGPGLRLSATVADVAYRGVDLLVTAEATDPAGRPARLIADLRGVLPGAIVPGQKVSLGIAPEHLIALAS